MNIRLFFLFGFCVSLIASSVKADLVLDLKYSDGSTSQMKNIGETVFLDLSITDTAPTSPSGSNILFDEGLFSGGGRILRSSGNATFAAHTASDIDLLWGAGGFDSNPASSGTGNELAKILGNTDLFLGPAAGVGLTTIRLARFAIQVTGGSGLSQLTADVLGAGFDGFSTFDTNNVLDGSIVTFNSVDLSVNGAAAVPEPASMVLGGITACVAGGAGWRRRRKIAADKASGV